MLIRREQAADVATVQRLHDAAFTPIRPATPDGVSIEARILERLRADPDAWLPQLSLVAEPAPGAAVTGHVVCSRARLDGALPVLGLGPIAVHPDHQGRGFGGALIHAACAAADACDEPVVVLLGDPTFYGRFGFVPAADHGIVAPDPAWGRYFQARPLSAFEPARHRGAFTYPPAFSSSGS